MTTIKKARAAANRVPVDASRSKLQVEFLDPTFRERFVPHWVNEENLDKYEAGGYFFVEPEQVNAENGAERTGADLGNRLRQRVGRTGNGDAQYAYLMAISKEYYEEDQQVHRNRVRQIEDQIMGRSGDVAPGISVRKAGITTGLAR